MAFAAAPSVPATVSGNVGGFQLIGQIARGGMATVFLCRRAGEGGFQRLFALKVLHPHLAEDEEFVRMLVDEACLAARLHHPNVVGIIDIGRHEAGHYLVMDYVEGCTLAHLLKRHPQSRPPGLVVPILIDTLRGLHAAHTLVDESGAPLQLVHRDVSPQNILVGLDGTARITDFGIAKAESRSGQTRPGIRKGKLEYMAPEQLRGDPSVDRRADVFSAGVVAFNALTGKRLFGGDTEGAIMHAVLQREVPPPSAVGLRPPDVFDEVILRALDRDPDRRPQSADEMASMLREAAMVAGMLAAPSAIADWVGKTFGEELAARRVVIAEAASRETVRMATIDEGSLVLPAISGSFPALTSLTPSTRSHQGVVSSVGLVSVVDTNAVDGEPRARRRRLAKILVIAGAVAVAAVLGIVLGTSGRSGGTPAPADRAGSSTQPRNGALATPVVPSSSTVVPSAGLPSSPVPGSVGQTGAGAPTQTVPVTARGTRTTVAGRVFRPRGHPPAATSHTANPSAPAPAPTASSAPPAAGQHPPAGIERNPYLRRQ